MSIIMKNVFWGVAMIAIFGACSTAPEKATQDHKHEKSQAIIEKANCVVHPTEGNDVNGTIAFEKTTDGVKVTADVAGLTPGKHGFHVHQYGDCSGPAGKTAGGHFNPEGKKHGAPDDMERHVGDLGNLVADSSGVASMTFTDSKLTLNGPNSIIGRSIIIHAGEDDLTSQPTGAAGARVACGVIGVAK
ncbi:Superoxide dismutase [Cu-Zn] precursor [Salinivirga cyanobacteriivorans]|uniref:Superoxide dismutase [Cu-Zn] n=1 Tax=Salinivirga cyanobacteriivorans TaxID=1307839 RepID=A0A0S2HY75_9BACT|nr:superoxide dismutase family protein [Salinivirga cyanobacteriivorans]ALO15041.1 Superoxide dismutase [Cu-Zn] precursor [Salinivirga cyanobacteriivorans]